MGRRRRRAAEVQKNTNKLDEMQDTIDIIEGRVAFIYFSLLNNPEWDKTTHMVSTGQIECGRREFETQMIFDSDDEDTGSWPPWRLLAAARWASLIHRLLVRQTIRNKHCATMTAINTYGRLLETFRQRTDPLSTRDVWSYIDR